MSRNLEVNITNGSIVNGLEQHDLLKKSVCGRNINLVVLLTTFKEKKT